MQHPKSSSPSKSTSPGFSGGYKSLMLNWITILTVKKPLDKETRSSLCLATCNKSTGTSNSVCLRDVIAT